MKRVWIVTVLSLALLLALGSLLVPIGAESPRIRELADRTPSRTAWMKAREAQARARGHRHVVDHRWLPYERISPLLRRAVLIAEDDAFFAHGGLDWNEIKASARANLGRGRIVRGGSTITQQLAKNLYLGEQRTPLRKLREMLLAVRMERALTKRRIFELYLNLIEWGDGVYGAEAAARRHFGVSASHLDARQAALLAAVIINPRRYSPAQPSPRIQRRTRTILARLHRRGAIDSAQYRAALGLPPIDSAAIATPPGPASTEGLVDTLLPEQGFEAIDDLVPSPTLPGSLGPRGPRDSLPVPGVGPGVLEGPSRGPPKRSDDR